MELLLQQMFHFFFHLISSLKALVPLLSPTISYLILFRVETFWWTLLYLFGPSIPLNMVCMQTSWHVLYDDYILFQYFSYPIFCHLSENGRKFTMGMLSLKKKSLTVRINSGSVSLLRHTELNLVLIPHFGSGVFCLILLWFHFTHLTLSVPN
jgi:hypothetical protein